jgi:NAD(P)H-flavin reductase/hemoglobin-like flavoprotein
MWYEHPWNLPYVKKVSCRPEAFVAPLVRHETLDPQIMDPVHSNVSRLLKESWALVEEQQDKVAGYFYARMFLSYPKLRDMFPVQMDVQRTRLLGAIVHAVQTFDEPDRVDEYLRALGRDHRKFAVEPEHYQMVKFALVQALREYAGDRWNLQYEQAWSDVYDLISAKMISGARDDEDEPPFRYAEVLTHERRGTDIAVFTCRPLRPLNFRAGQYVSIETRYQPRLWRTYSMANAPREDGTIEFHVKAIGAGWVSSALVRRLKAGDLLKLATPMGSMTLDPESRRDIVCVAGGTGLAPVKALIDELSRYNRTRFVHLFRGVRTRDDLYDRHHIDELVGRYPWLTLTRAVSEDTGFTDAIQGNVADVVAEHGPWPEHDFFVSGSPGMVSTTLRQLSHLQVPSSRIKYDTFA